MISSLAFPPAREVRGRVAVPPSKSATNRALVLAATSSAPVEIARPLVSEDTDALVLCLVGMGARVKRSPDGLLVGGPLGAPTDRVTELDARDSGTAARFLAALACGVPGDFRLRGSPRLSERPMGPLVSALRSAGADVREEGASGRLPLRIRGRALPAGRVLVDASRSSQFLSALLLLAAAGAPLEVGAEGEIASAPYVATTLEALAAFGHRVSGSGPWTIERAGAPPPRYDTPGDYSSAIPLAAAAGVCGGEVSLAGLAWPSQDADAGALAVLERMGVSISRAAGLVTARAERGRVVPVAARATEFPDAVPALAALAAFASGESRFEGIGHLRWKESDRLTSLAEILGRVGTRARAEETVLVVSGGGGPPPAGADLPTFRDHRMAMAGALLALGRPGIRIEDPDCVAKSYPEFFRDLDSLCVR